MILELYLTFRILSGQLRTLDEADLNLWEVNIAHNDIDEILGLLIKDSLIKVTTLPNHVRWHELTSATSKCLFLIFYCRVRRINKVVSLASKDMC